MAVLLPQSPEQLQSPCCPLGTQQAGGDCSKRMFFRIYFLPDRECFLVQEQESTMPSGMSAWISFPRHWLCWGHSQSCCVPLPRHLPCLHLHLSLWHSPAAEQTLHTAKPAGELLSLGRGTRQNKVIRQGGGMANSAFHNPWTTG